MKKVVIVILFVIFIGELYVFVDNQNKNSKLENEISKTEELIVNEESKQEENNKKKKKLELLKEENKDLIEKYEEVEAWNEEIVNYLK